MALPTSATPARLAVVAALTTVTGQPRALGTSQLFMSATDDPATARAVKAKVSKRAWVVFENPIAEHGGVEFGGSLIIDYTVRVVCTYYAGSGNFSLERERVLAAIEDDESPIRAALCAPEALRTSPAGSTYPYNVDTGLAGGALRWPPGQFAAGPIFSPSDDERKAVVTHFFIASIDTLQPT